MERKDLFALAFWPEIETELRQDGAVLPISKRLQERGYFTDVKLHTLNKMLSRIKDGLQGRVPDYRADKGRELIRTALKKFPKLKRYVKSIGRKIDTLQELHGLYEYQIGRLDRYIELEQAADFPLSTVQREIKELRDTLLAIRQIHVELGLEEKRPEELLLRFDERILQVPEEKRERIRQVIRLMKSEGAWKLPPPDHEEDE